MEDRLRRIESVLGLDSSPPPGQHEPESPLDEAMDPPRFQLGGDDHPVYHGETSMHDDVTDASFATKGASTNRSVDVSSWKEEDLRALTRLRHKFASADEGEMWMDACFCWTSPTYAVVNRAVFLRKPGRSGCAAGTDPQATWRSTGRCLVICCYWRYTSLACGSPPTFRRRRGRARRQGSWGL